MVFGMADHLEAGVPRAVFEVTDTLYRVSAAGKLHRRRDCLPRWKTVETLEVALTELAEGRLCDRCYPYLPVLGPVTDAFWAAELLREAYALVDEPDPAGAGVLYAAECEAANRDLRAARDRGSNDGLAAECERLLPELARRAATARAAADVCPDLWRLRALVESHLSHLGIDGDTAAAMTVDGRPTRRVLTPWTYAAFLTCLTEALDAAQQGGDANLEEVWQDAAGRLPDRVVDLSGRTVEPSTRCTPERAARIAAAVVAYTRSRVEHLLQRLGSEEVWLLIRSRTGTRERGLDSRDVALIAPARDLSPVADYILVRVPRLIADDIAGRARVLGRSAPQTAEVAGTDGPDEARTALALLRSGAHPRFEDAFDVARLIHAPAA